MIEVNKISQKQIHTFLTLMDGHFSPPLSERVHLLSYSEKLFKKASTLFIFIDNIAVSGVFFYKNPESGVIYIPVIATLPQFQGKGYFQEILDKLFEILRGSVYSLVRLETWQGGKALNYYIKNGFRIEDKIFDRRGNYSVKLFKRINQEIDCIKFNETPLYLDKKLSILTSNNVYIKRDDLFPVIGGGSKGRKLFYILKEAIADGISTVVTCGSNQSSHLRATAILCAQLGLKSVLIIHDTQLHTGKAPNVKVLDFYADQIVYCDLKEVKEVMDEAVSESVAANEKPLYIFGGGHCLEGTYAYYDAVRNLHRTNDIECLDYVFVASGTGTTQAGLHIGMSEFFPKSKVIGVSISRNRKRGIEVINQSIKQFRMFQNCPYADYNEIEFDDNFLDGGYGKCSEENMVIINKYSRKLGLGLDHTYSGKAFLGLLSHLITIENKNVLFWNTGSTLNFIEDL